MFQAGYITISGYDEINDLYSLAMPNKEVEIAFNEYLLEAFTNLNAGRINAMSGELRREFNGGNAEGIISTLRQLLSSVPYQIHLKDEKFYHGLIQMACVAAGTLYAIRIFFSIGRADIIVTTAKFLYVIELKLNQPAEIALQQIKERRYYEQFLNQGKPIILLGISVTKEPKVFDVTYAFEKI